MKWAVLLGLPLLAALPSTTNYKLNSYGFGSGGTNNSSTATYSLEGTSGEISGAPSSTVNNTVKPAFIQTEQAHVPQLSALDNGSGQYYNKLHFVIDNQSNPTDATFLISVSTDNFVSNTTYLQTDGTLSSSLVLTDYRTYSAWGGSGGSYIIGLNPNTTYYVRLKATQGKFTESAYGPISSQATASQTLSFNLVTSNQPSPPFSISLGALSAGSVVSSSQTINPSFSTNGASGGDIYVTSKYGGLKSSSTGYTIVGVSNDLSLGGVTEGYGAQSSSVSQASGATFTAVTPYNNSGANVGILDTATRSLYTVSGPVTTGAGTLTLKAKAASTDPAATDYQDVLTFTAAGNF